MLNMQADDKAVVCILSVVIQSTMAAAIPTLIVYLITGQKKQGRDFRAALHLAGKTPRQYL